MSKRSKLGGRGGLGTLGSNEWSGRTFVSWTDRISDSMEVKIPTHLPRSHPDHVILNMYVYASIICFRRGYDVTEPEIRSAINWATYKAWRNWHKDRQVLIQTLAASYALDECAKVLDMFRDWAKQDIAGREQGKYHPPTETIIPLADFEVLSFIAAHGRKKSALMLGMKPESLRDLLDEISFRIERGRSTK